MKYRMAFFILFFHALLGVVRASAEDERNAQILHKGVWPGPIIPMAEQPKTVQDCLGESSLLSSRPFPNHLGIINSRPQEPTLFIGYPSDQSHLLQTTLYQPMYTCH